jgi:hypothetical protein
MSSKILDLICVAGTQKFIEYNLYSALHHGTIRSRTGHSAISSIRTKVLYSSGTPKIYKMKIEYYNETSFATGIYSIKSKSHFHLNIILQ